jgi:LmbE family N-acetylglucosaminyl deacetylase
MAVLSPHLDDAALSLGATIARASSSGVEVNVVTVFAYDPSTTAAAGPWDSACGFSSAAEAARVRRAEDAEACALLGAVPVWLPFMDVEYGGADQREIEDALADVVRSVDTVLAPGSPLTASDHALVATIALGDAVRAPRLGLYVEQPYASWTVMGRGGRHGATGLSLGKGLQNAIRIGLRGERAQRLLRPTVPDSIRPLVPGAEWEPVPVGGREWALKRRAIKAHRSQVAGFGPLVLARVALHEWGWGGEGLAWISKPS